MSVINDLLVCIQDKSPLQARNIDKYLGEMDVIEKEKLNRRLEYLVFSGETIESIVTSYLSFCEYFMIERKYFVENGSYRYSSYEEAAVLYNDTEYMKNYMIGLPLGLYLWRMQRDSMRFFREKCKLDKHTSGKYLEVGPGHGEYLVTAIENMNFDEYYAIDISQSSVEMTKGFVSYVYGTKPEIFGKINIERKDFFELENKIYDAIVISEVLEHVENPYDFLCKIKELSNKDTFIYLSTAINSPFPDHLYHFHNREEVCKMIQDSGLKIVDEVMSTAEGITLDRAIKKNYDITIGFILKI